MQIFTGTVCFCYPQSFKVFQCCITNHCLFHITWEQRVRHRLTPMFLWSSGDDTSLLEKQIICSYFCLLPFNQVSIQAKSHCRTTFDEKPWQIPAGYSCQWHQLYCLAISSLLSSILSQGETTDHVHIFIFCHWLFWVGESPQSTLSSWEHQLSYAIGIHCQCSLSSQEGLIFLLSPGDSQPFKAWVCMNRLFNTKKIIILQKLMILIKLMLSTQVLFSTVLKSLFSVLSFLKMIFAVCFGSAFSCSSLLDVHSGGREVLC